MSDATLRRPHPMALASFVLGLGSLVLLAVAGIPAVLCGVRGLRAVNLSDGRVGGRRLALAGIALGGVTSLLTLVGFSAIIFIRLAEGSRRVECTDNLRQLGQALTKYATTHGSLPPATRDPKDLPPARRLSWLTELLPMLGEPRPINRAYAGLALKIDRRAAWDDPQNAEAAAVVVRAFLCPSHPAPARAPLTHYVGVAGVGADAAELKREAPRAGAFGHGRGVRPQEMTGGISHTMMAVETARDNGRWVAGGWPTVRGLAADEEAPFGHGGAFGGLHRDVTNVLWGDGSVRPVRDDTPGDLLRRQAVLRGADAGPVFARGGD